MTAVPDPVSARSRVAPPGDLDRLRRVLERARRGGPVTVGAIGGSITQGSRATAPERRYASRVAQWWRDTFPAADVRLVNAGFGATGSDFGALRVARDLLAHRPDFVVVDFAVNDGNTRASAETLEGVLRQILALPNHPAAALLFFMREDGTNAQEWLSKVGAHYRLPMLSYRDALWPEIEAGRLAWDDISPDTVHPNDRGHDLAARFVADLLAGALAALPPEGTPLRSDTAPLPPPLLTDAFARTALFEAADLTPLTSDGWAYDPEGGAWVSDRPGSVIEFEVNGGILLTMHRVVRGPMGRASVRVDDAPLVTLDGWFDQTWGGYRHTTRLAESLAYDARHRVQIELLPGRSAGSTGTEFRLLGLGAADFDPTTSQ